MKIAIVGSRTVPETDEMYSFLSQQLKDLNPSVIISGGAKGADKLAERYAKEHNLKLIVHLPDYNQYPPKTAPIIRNSLIVQDCEICVALWDGKSKGTLDSITKCRAQKKRVIIVNI